MRIEDVLAMLAAVFGLGYGLLVLKRPYTITKFSPYFSKLAQSNPPQFLSVAKIFSIYSMLLGLLILFLSLVFRG